MKIRQVLKDSYMQALIAIFLLSCLIRFIYFPDNIYFGYDQARDAFSIREILSGNWKIVGPTTSIEGLHHGSLYYYIFAPFYFLTRGDPVGVASFLRIFNALGVFVIYYIAKLLFNKKVGILAAILFGLSFEQTQYSIYINHPSLTILTVLIYYLGWILFLFKNNPFGFALMFLGLGLSLQFEFVMVYLLIPSLVLGVISIKKILNLKPKIKSLALACLIIPLGSYLVAEFKMGFQSLHNLTKLTPYSMASPGMILQQVQNLLERYFSYNLFAFQPLIWVFISLMAFCLGFLIRQKQLRYKLLFLLLWFLGGFINYLSNFSTIPILHYGAGASISLLIIFGFFSYLLIRKNIYLGLFIFAIPVISNIYLITTINPRGSLPEVNVQSGMLLQDQKKVIDYTYLQSNGDEFAVNALSMPMNVNTVWSYLYETYGDTRYNYLPLWGGDAADGFPGNLKVEKARSKLPEQRYLIIEPTRGIYPYLIEDFIKNEDIFSKILYSKEYGLIKVEKRIRI